MVKVSKIFSCILVIVMIIYIGGAAIFQIPFLSDKGQARIIISIMAIVTWIFMLQNKLFKYTKKYTNSFLDKYLIILVIILFVQMLYGIVEYNQSVVDMYIVMSEYIFMLFSYPLLYILDRKSNELFKNMSKIVFVYVLINITQAVALNITGNSYFSAIEYSFRNGMARITMNAIVPIWTIFVIYFAINNKHKILNWLFFIVLLGTVVLIIQTRMMTVSLIGAIIAIVLFKKRKNINTVFVYLIIILGIGLLVQSGILDSFFDSFSQNSTEASSTLVRMSAIEYFWKFFEKNPLLGMGYIRPVNERLTLIWSGPLKKYYLNDLGAIGFLCRVGLCSIFIYWIPLIRMFYIAILLLKKKIKEAPLLLGLAVYLLLTSVSLIITDQERLMWFPFLICIFEYYMYQSKNNVELNL